MTEQGRVQKGTAGAGQWTATTHTPASLDLGNVTPESRRKEVAALVEHTVAVRKAKMGALRARLKAMEDEDAMIGAAKAAVELRKTFPTAGSIDFERLNAGVALWKDIRDREGVLIADRNNVTPFSDASNTAHAAAEHLRNISTDDFGAQGIVPLGTDGTLHRVNLDVALDRVAERLQAATPAGASAERSSSALAIWDEGDGPHITFRDMFTDMRHAADAAGIDLRDAFEDSHQVYLREKNDPAFQAGLEQP
jgi:hypothetical protein